MRSWTTRTDTELTFGLIFALVLGGALGCNVYDGGLLNDDPDTGTGCSAGTADCDGNGSCESDLTSEATCGSCENRCLAGERCVAGSLCLGEGEDAEIPDSGIPDVSGDAPIDAPDASTGGRRWPGRPGPETEGRTPPRESGP